MRELTRAMAQAFAAMYREARFDPLDPGREYLGMSASEWPCPECEKPLSVDLASVDRYRRASSSCECGWRGRTLLPRDFAPVSESSEESEPVDTAPDQEEEE